MKYIYLPYLAYLPRVSTSMSYYADKRSVERQWVTNTQLPHHDCIPSFEALAIVLGILLLDLRKAWGEQQEKQLGQYPTPETKKEKK
jgi:hypothetical protein